MKQKKSLFFLFIAFVILVSSHESIAQIATQQINSAAFPKFLSIEQLQVSFVNVKPIDLEAVKALGGQQILQELPKQLHYIILRGIK